MEDMEEILAGRLGGLNRPPELPEALRLEESFSLTRALDSYERELLSRAMAAGRLHLPGSPPAGPVPAEFEVQAEKI